jgi:outer membrane biosynthesis protein TonB
VIGTTGELRNIEVLEGNPILLPAALRALKKWRYSVCKLNGTAIEPITAIDVPFNLSQ